MTEPVDNPCRTQGVPTNSQIYTHSEVLTEVSRYPSLTSMEMSHYCRIKSVSWGSVAQVGEFRIQHWSSIGVTHLVCV